MLKQSSVNKPLWADWMKCRIARPEATEAIHSNILIRKKGAEKRHLTRRLQDLIPKANLCVMAAWLAVGLVASANANTQQKPQAGSQAKAASLPPISNLIGRENVGIRYPDGWVYRGSSGFGSEHGEIFLRRGRQHGILIVRIAEKPQPGQHTKKVVLDALAVKVDPQDAFKFSESCKTENGPDDFILAEVRFKRCERYSTRVSRAWRLDSNNWKFVPLSPKGMRCENVLWNEGAEESNCPSGIDISSKAKPSK